MVQGSRSRLFLIVAGIVVTLDQLTKHIIMALLPEGTWHFTAYADQPTPITIIPGFFHLVHVTNEGAAFSKLQGHGRLLGLFGFVALFLIYRFREALELDRNPQRFLFALICGGIIGNMIDRLRWGHVIDFLDLQFGNYHYPSFNIADSAISIGVISYIILTLLYPKKPPGMPQLSP